jgi:hypothetical protein
MDGRFQVEFQVANARRLTTEGSLWYLTATHPEDMPHTPSQSAEIEFGIVQKSDVNPWSARRRR